MSHVEVGFTTPVDLTLVAPRVEASYLPGVTTVESAVTPPSGRVFGLREVILRVRGSRALELLGAAAMAGSLLIGTTACDSRYVEERMAQQFENVPGQDWLHDAADAIDRAGTEAADTGRGVDQLGKVAGQVGEGLGSAAGEAMHSADEAGAQAAQRVREGKEADRNKPCSELQKRLRAQTCRK